MTPIRKVGIIGTGQMGSGIAHVVALSGYDVLLNDLSKEKVDKGAGGHRQKPHPPDRLGQDHRGGAQAGARAASLMPRPSRASPTPIS